MNPTIIAKPAADVPGSPAPAAPPALAPPAPPVVAPTEPGPQARVGSDTVRKILLAGGVLSSVLYLAADVSAWSQYPGYSPVARTFSELLAADAPTRSFMLAVVGAPYNLLVAGLGVALWASSDYRRVARITGALLVLYAVVSYLGGTVFNLGVAGPEGAARVMLHASGTAVMVLAMLLAMGCGAFLHGTRFRRYSLGTLLTVLVFAGLSFVQAAKLAANEPAPWIGLIERVNIYAWMLWVAVLAISLWPGRHASTPP